MLSALSVTSIRNYEIYLLDVKSESPRTVNLHLSVLSGFCRYLIRNGLLESNPVRLVSRPKMKKRLPEFFREESMEIYFRETGPDVLPENLGLIRGNDKLSCQIYKKRLDRMIISLLYQTGIRRSELIALNISSVDFSRSILRVHGKGEKTREIPLGPVLCDEISLYLQSTAALIGQDRAGNEP